MIDLLGYLIGEELLSLPIRGSFTSNMSMSVASHGPHLNFPIGKFFSTRWPMCCYFPDRENDDGNTSQNSSRYRRLGSEYTQGAKLAAGRTCRRFRRRASVYCRSRGRQAHGSNRKSIAGSPNTRLLHRHSGTRRAQTMMIKALVYTMETPIPAHRMFRSLCDPIWWCRLNEMQKTEQSLCKYPSKPHNKMPIWSIRWEMLLKKAAIHHGICQFVS